MITNYVIVGCSRGLGAALVDACLQQEPLQVIGISRSPADTIERYDAWTGTGRFRYYRSDIGSPGDSLKEIALPQGACCVIYNAAIIETEFKDAGVFDREIYDRVNRVAIDGFGCVLDAFGPHLREQRGMLVGIASLSAVVPLSLEPLMAYPAGKAYLMTALRSLAVAWRGRVRVMTVLLGHVGTKKFDKLPEWIVPRYGTVAKKILRATQSSSPRPVLAIPVLSRFAYGFLSLLPFSFSLAVFRAIRGWLAFGERRKGS